MKRFFGMMPSTEIEIEKCYKDKDGYKITIQAGKNGWTIIYADYSTDFKDIISSANKNFEEAYNLAVNRLGTLTEITAQEVPVQEQSINSKLELNQRRGIENEF